MRLPAPVVRYWTRGISPEILSEANYPSLYTYRFPLKVGLRILRGLSRTVTPCGRVGSFGRTALGLHGSALKRWHARVWWANYATELCKSLVVSGKRADEVFALLRPVDWSPLERLLATGNGVILVSAHIGVPQVVSALLCRAGRSPLRLNRWGVFQHPSVDVSQRENPGYLTQLYARAYYHLKAGGIVTNAPDGPFGRTFAEAEFMGRPVQISRAAVALARFSGASTLPYLVRWVGYRLSVEFAEPIGPHAASPEEWDRRWIQEYLGWMEHQIRMYPEVLRFALAYL